MATASIDTTPDQGFDHRALFYTGAEGFLDAVTPFVAQGAAAGDPVLVMVSAAKTDLLRPAIPAGAPVEFADTGRLGVNPGRIISAWSDFLVRHPGRRLRGVGEPIWPGRTPDEVVEAERHEALLNLAFAQAPFTLACPYDTAALAPDVVARAHRSHPVVAERGQARASDGYDGVAGLGGPLDDRLPAPPHGALAMTFTIDDLHRVRAFVVERAAAAGYHRERRTDLALAVNELVTNSVRHGGGRGIVRCWADDGDFVCEVRDAGHIDDPLVGRIAPPHGQQGGRGLWIVNQLSDLVQIRAAPDGLAVRVRFR